MKPPAFDLEEVPLSVRGAWFGLNRLTGNRATELGKEPGLYLRTYRGQVPMPTREVAALRFHSCRNKLARLQEHARPGRLDIRAGGRVGAGACFASPRTLVLEGRGLFLEMDFLPTLYDFARPGRGGSWELNLFSRRTQFLLTIHTGQCGVDAPWNGLGCGRIRLRAGADGRPWRLSLTEFSSTPPAPPRLPSGPSGNSQEAAFLRFAAKLPRVPRALERARSLAGGVLWTSLAAPSGLLAREAMLMSKNWMVNVWSWDHCFNAIALASAHPALAWDQWALPFDHQDASGALPDCLNDREIVTNFTKPPVHGWALREMTGRGFRLTPARARQAVRCLERWTDWWLAPHHDDDGDGIPQYNHGNDSGWDNASCFASGMPVEGPDLAAFLVVQMDVIADLHHRLGAKRKSTHWRQRADRLCARLLAHSWRENRFIAPRSGDHMIAGGDSLVNFMPLLLGHRLPAPHRAALIRGLAQPGRFLTARGLATESLQSPLYTVDGYWRGPIWAPSTHLLVSALRRLGEHRLAHRISLRFCRTFAQSGSAENFDAVSGGGLRDRAYTWTASSFLVLASGLRSPKS